MRDLLLLLPDFLLIASGFVICRTTALDRTVWQAAERLVYYLLFPVLLFTSIVRNPLGPGEAAWLALAGLATVALGVALAYALARWPGVDPARHADAAGLDCPAAGNAVAKAAPPCAVRRSTVRGLAQKSRGARRVMTRRAARRSDRPGTTGLATHEPWHPVHPRMPISRQFADSDEFALGRSLTRAIQACTFFNAGSIFAPVDT